MLDDLEDYPYFKNSKVLSGRSRNYVDYGFFRTEDFNEEEKKKKDKKQDAIVQGVIRNDNTYTAQDN